MTEMGSLLVAGAGPKGIAIAAKAAALAAAGLPAPEVTVVDPLGVAGYWNGKSGYTDGRRQLGTRPEKDLGFPYPPSWGEGSGEVNARMQALSWHRYLMATSQLGDWVDRAALGRRTSAGPSTSPGPRRRRGSMCAARRSAR